MADFTAAATILREAADTLIETAKGWEQNAGTLQNRVNELLASARQARADAQTARAAAEHLVPPETEETTESAIEECALEPVGWAEDVMDDRPPRKGK